MQLSIRQAMLNSSSSCYLTSKLPFHLGPTKVITATRTLLVVINSAIKYIRKHAKNKVNLNALQIYK